MIYLEVVIIITAVVLGMLLGVLIEMYTSSKRTEGQIDDMIETLEQIIANDKKVREMTAQNATAVSPDAAPVQVEEMHSDAVHNCTSCAFYRSDGFYHWFECHLNPERTEYIRNHRLEACSGYKSRPDE